MSLLSQMVKCAPVFSIFTCVYFPTPSNNNNINIDNNTKVTLLFTIHTDTFANGTYKYNKIQHASIFAMISEKCYFQTNMIKKKQQQLYGDLLTYILEDC